VSSLLDQYVGQLVTSLLSAAGDEFTYSEGDVPDGQIVRAAKSTPPSQVIEAEAGQTVEMEFADFKLRTSDLPYGLPKPGHRISQSSGSAEEVWEVQPRNPGEKCYYQQSPQMIRIHTVLISRSV
jgi:hypothetical protein